MLKKITTLENSKLINRYPALMSAEKDIINAINVIARSFSLGGKLITMGNGGSSADAEHICGELVKGFILNRKLSSQEKQLFAEIDPTLSENIQGSLPAISLSVQHSTISAFSNDMAPEYCFAQQIWGLGMKNDIILGISTSGNSKNIVHGLNVAKAKGLTTIGLTGINDSKVSQIADICIKAPDNITHHIQELHLPIYHSICIELENIFFD